MTRERDAALLEQILDRRSFLGEITTGLAGIGLAGLLGRDLAAQATPQFPAKAKQRIHSVKYQFFVLIQTAPL